MVTGNSVVDWINHGHNGASRGEAMVSAILSSPVVYPVASFISSPNSNSQKRLSLPNFTHLPSLSSFSRTNLRSFSRFEKKFIANSSTERFQQQNDEKELPQEEEEFQVLTAVRSKYNEIVIVETRQSRMLLLDSTRNLRLHYARSFVA